MLYLAAVAVAAVVSVVSGEVDPLWTVASGSGFWTWLEPGTWLAALLPAFFGLNAWALWQVLRGPALPRAQGLPRRVVWLRRLLYLDLAGGLLLWELAEELSDPVEDVLAPAVWIAAMILLTMALTGVSVAFRAIALALGLAEVVYTPFVNLGMGREYAVLVMLGLASYGWTVMILIGQRRDGRWSRATVRIGWLAFAADVAAWVGHRVVEGAWFPGFSLVLGTLGLLDLVWRARTAHELARTTQETAHTAPGPVRRGRVPRLLSAATVLVLPLVLVVAEEEARFGFSGWDDRCWDWIDGPRRSYGATRQEDRRVAFLCHARNDSFGVTPMFPHDMPDQRVLSYGRALCGTPDQEARQALLRRAGGSASVHDLTQALVFLCPDVVGRERPDLLRTEAQVKQDEARWSAEANARCSDPWPKARARRQGTAAYLLFEGGGYAVHDDEDTTEDDGDGSQDAADDAFVHAVGSVADIETYGENENICVTVKAFDKAPPLRLKGWEQVVEVGVASRTGRLVVPEMPENGDQGALKPLPNLAVDGPGRYRVRVYARHWERDEAEPDAPAEDHLIVVYPGRSTKKIVHVPS